MLKARVTLQNLKTLGYTFPDKDVCLAEEFTQQLDKLYGSFYSRLPNEAGLIILPQIQDSIRSTKKREHTNRNIECANLPPRKKYKKGWTADLTLRLIGYKRTQTSQRYAQINTTFTLLSLMLHIQLEVEKVKHIEED